MHNVKFIEPEKTSIEIALSVRAANGYLKAIGGLDHKGKHTARSRALYQG